MTITVTDYLEVVSSWCFWSEPTWAELKRRYDGEVQFQWKIALIDPGGCQLHASKSDGSIDAVE
jgi:predicted DsbA family dithiol-disulfide isomerase